MLLHEAVVAGQDAVKPGRCLTIGLRIEVLCGSGDEIKGRSVALRRLDEAVLDEGHVIDAADILHMIGDQLMGIIAAHVLNGERGQGDAHSFTG